MARRTPPTKDVTLTGWMDRLKRIEEKTERLSLLSHLGQILNSTLDHSRGSEKGHGSRHPTDEG